MDKNYEYEERIRAIHRRENAREKDKNLPSADAIRHEEFQAMADVNLGPDYDREKLQKVESLQIEFRKEHVKLNNLFAKHEISQDEYAASVRRNMERLAVNYEEILGKSDFVKLFGGSPDEVMPHDEIESLREESE